MSAHHQDIADWIGRTEQVDDTLAVEQASAAAAMFDLGATRMMTVGDALPPLWQWFYFLPRAAQSALDVDGHPRRGGFMPPVQLPRRMFAGARVRVHQPLCLGVPARREGLIRDVSTKQGRSGSLAFVTVQYRFVQDGVLCVEEEQDIVYKEPGAPVPPPDVRPWTDAPVDAVVRDVRADSRMLFRFSALTFNAHRIHYDREYAMRDEGYPGLVVHGPLTAMLLSQLAMEAQPAGVLREFSFRGVAPLFDTAPFRLLAVRDGGSVRLEAIGPDGATCLRADASFANAPSPTVPVPDRASST
jgi:3-methylfumaryl-CoA hydratase